MTSGLSVGNLSQSYSRILSTRMKADRLMLSSLKPQALSDFKEMMKVNDSVSLYQYSAPVFNPTPEGQIVVVKPGATVTIKAAEADTEAYLYTIKKLETKIVDLETALKADRMAIKTYVNQLRDSSSRTRTLEHNLNNRLKKANDEITHLTELNNNQAELIGKFQVKIKNLIGDRYYSLNNMVVEFSHGQLQVTEFAASMYSARERAKELNKK